ncbi:MAG: hypothetical protein ABIM50_01260 [Novosphingobium sp.]
MEGEVLRDDQWERLREFVPGGRKGTLPFLFGLTPLTSLIFEASGNYHLPMAMLVGGFIVAALLLALLVHKERGG